MNNVPYLFDINWQPVMNSLDIPYRTFEQTRHTYASLLLADGAKIGYISKQMGHSNIHITLTTYVDHIPSEDDKAVLSKVTEMLQTSVHTDETEIFNKLKSHAN